MLNFEPGNRLRAAANAIADATLERDYGRRPELLGRYGAAGRVKYRQDIMFDLAALAVAVDAGDGEIFVRYVAWLKVLLIHRGVAIHDIAESLRCMAFAMGGAGGSGHGLALSHLQAALDRIDAMPEAISSFIEGPGEELAAARRCLQALLRLDAPAARRSLETVLESGLPLVRIHLAIVPALMREVGRLWQMNEISVAHEHYCTAAMQSILSGFNGAMFDGAPAGSGRTMVVACVDGEQHELGARTVADVFELNGWRTSFLGANLPARELVRLIGEAQRPPDVIALSATMPEHLGQLAATIEALRDRSKIPIMVGGYLFNGGVDLAARMGADGCSEDAEAALGVANALVARPG
jgi:MerR family transcriptional regulator, light-induced transcriptional regulator